MATEETDRHERAARNQSFFRAINDEVKKLNDETGLFNDFGPPAAITQWVCECADTSCMERITVTSVTYEGVRAVPYRFIVAPSDEHFFPDVEEIVERHSDYWIVDKQGEAKEVATRMSQRAAS